MPVRVFKQNFNKDDCIHYKRTLVKACCGRSHEVGVCTIDYSDYSQSKMCSTKASYCQYEKREDNNVHIKELPDYNGRDSNSN